MNLKEKVKNSIKNSLKILQNQDFFDTVFDVNDLSFNVSEPNVPDDLNIDQVSYNYSTNIAFVLKQFKKTSPFLIAQKLVEVLKQDSIFSQIDIAIPGFINIVISDSEFISIIKNILLKNDRYASNFVLPEKINVEYVSANPTGFLHVGHVRGAVFGDSLIRILKFAGHSVESEYYVNDAGNQINILGISAMIRYKELFGILEELPEDSYKGQDIVWAAQKIKEKFQDKFLNCDQETYLEFKNEVVKILLEKIKYDLKRLNINIDTYSSEKDLYKNDSIKNVLEKLKPNTYKKDNALFLKTTQFGDDKDRVLIKSDESMTYLTPDIAYHQTKLNKAQKLINIWGADHSGYIARMKIAIQCLGYNPDNLDVLVIQLVRLLKNGEEFKMSKRAGTSVTLEDFLNVASSDVIRFTMLTREINNKFDFDIDLANSQNLNNPVYIVQYSYSRTVSLLKNLVTPNLEKDVLFTSKAKKILLHLNEFQDILKTIVLTSKVNLLSQYLLTLANLFNSFYAETKLLNHKNESEYAALVKVTQIVLKIGLDLLGVSAPESM
ncbi:arginine--tRNA ligase [Mycoplasma leonicaptivi]|uniref:arginine--tRNA ligase n=1 Tax=Mycoplasma leonicaptivi TaxID=36742 RepID=UPI0004855165|nr:arginine--tRNA ligase [Mycoplasma leonicaptivi]